MPQIKKTIVFTEDGIFVEGYSLRQCDPKVSYSHEDVNIYQGDKLVENIDLFNQLFKTFQDVYPTDIEIEKILCEEPENKLQIAIKKRLKKVHSSYKLKFFLCEFPFYRDIRNKSKEMKEVENNPSLPMGDSDNREMTVDDAKLEDLKKQIRNIEKDLSDSIDENPDIDMVLMTAKSEYKTGKTVITFSLSPDDVYEILKQKIKTINHSYALFLTPNVD